MTLNQLLTGGPQPPWLRWVFLVGVATLITRLVMGSPLYTTSVFYTLVPFVIGLIIYLFTPYSRELTKWGRAARHIRSTIIVMLASSAILFEGFICVVFAMPIYLFFAGIVLAVMPPPEPDADQKARIRDTFNGSALPLVVLVALLSMEGALPGLSFEREHSVTRTRTVPASLDEIHAQLAQPIALTEDRSRFLSLFPLPHTVEAGSLAEGDIHTSHFTYRRWPIGNTHEGRTRVELTSVEAQRIKTTVLENDAYFSHYLTIRGTQIDLAPQADGTTEVSLTIDYRRDLDPAWYFGPLQKRAVGESAEYLIGQIIAPAASLAE